MNDEDSFLSKLIGDDCVPPPVSTAGIILSKPGYEFHYHSYVDEVELLCVLHGASYVGINNQFIRVKKNDCLLIFPGVTHNYFLKENESCKAIDLVFRPGDVSRLVPLDMHRNLRLFHELLQPQGDYLRFVDDGAIRTTLERILLQYENPLPPARRLLKIYFCELYVLLSEVIRATRDELGKSSNPHIALGLDYLANHYSDPVTVENLARQVGLSSRHFSRLFVRELGMTVPNYLSLLRIRRAKELLQNSDMDVTRIAYALGFNSSQYFITCFKRVEHVTPKEYRSKVRNTHRPAG